MRHLLEFSIWTDRINEEIFSRPYDLVKIKDGWKFKTDSGAVYHIEFMSYVDDIEDLEIDFDTPFDPAELFAYIKSSKKDWVVKHEFGFYRKGRFFWQRKSDITGTGDAYRIFATVISAIQEYIKKTRVDWLVFKTLPNPSSRLKLYDRLSKELGEKFGFDEIYKDVNSDQVTYNLKKKNENSKVR